MDRNPEGAQAAMDDRAASAATLWDELVREFDAWRRADRIATFWWRDDDAASGHPRLDRLLDISDGLPITLAVVPGLADQSLVERTRRAAGATVVQHGWTHRNHAPKGERAAEFGGHRPVDIMLDELAGGWQALSRLFGGQALPLFVPPWNRIADIIVPRLSEAGYRGLSTSGPRKRREASPGVVQVNAHVDLVDWRSRSFIGAAEASRRILEHLSARRGGRVDGDEPTGILSHHLCMDAASEMFLQQFVALTRAHPAARWMTAREAFAMSPPQ